MNILYDLLTLYGAPIIVLAITIICLVGCLKLAGIFNRIKSAQLKKALYVTLDIILAFIVAAVYYRLFTRPFDDYVIFSISLVVAIIILYTPYEVYGLRGIVQMLIALVQKWMNSNQAHKLTKLAKKYGIDKAIIQLQTEAAKANTNKATPQITTQVKIIK